MLFTRAPDDLGDIGTSPDPGQVIPTFLADLLSHLSSLLRPLVPPKTHDMLFSQPLARQIILNLYPPGTGITPHVDLPDRYADGILGVSLLGSCTMELESDIGETAEVYMPRGTVYAMTGEARWYWSHGITGRMADVVKDDDQTTTKGNDSDTGVVDMGVHKAERSRTIMRGTRVSVTFRWMQPGGDVLR